MENEVVKKSRPKRISFKKRTKLLGPNLELVRTSMEHIKPLFKHITSSGVLDKLTIDIRNFEDFRKYFLFISNQWLLNNDLTFSILDKSKNPIGQISIYNIKYNHQMGEVGIWLGNLVWRKGYGLEALKIILRHAFQDLNLNRIQAHIFPENSASIALFETLGFLREGLNRQFVKKRKKFRDVYCYAILRDEWSDI